MQQVLTDMYNSLNISDSITVEEFTTYVNTKTKFNILYKHWDKIDYNKRPYIGIRDNTLDKIFIYTIHHKVCNKCKVNKPLNQFSKNKNSKYGVHSYCKGCVHEILHIWYIKNKEKVRKRGIIYTNKTRDKINKREKGYRKTIKGYINTMYNNQVLSSKHRGHIPPLYTKHQLHMWILNRPNHRQLYETWRDSDYNKWLKPSVDRLDDDKGYSLDNIQLITWKENDDKGNIKQSIPIIATNINTNITTKYISIMEASKTLNIIHGTIRYNLDKNKVHKGYKFTTYRE